MSEQAASPPVSDPVAPVETGEQTVPYHRFKQANDQLRETRKQFEEMQARLEEIENRDKSELEKERTKREQWERQAQEMESRLTRVERSGWVRAAASESGFDDPDDAVAFINVGEIESADDAAKAVKSLAKRKPRLLREAPQTPPIGQVVAGGQPVQAGGQQQQEMDPAGVALLRQLEAAQATGWTSVPATE